MPPAARQTPPCGSAWRPANPANPPGVRAPFYGADYWYSIATTPPSAVHWNRMAGTCPPSPSPAA